MWNENCIEHLHIFLSRHLHHCNSLSCPVLSAIPRLPTLLRLLQLPLYIYTCNTVMCSTTHLIHMYPYGYNSTGHAITTVTHTLSGYALVCVWVCARVTVNTILKAIVFSVHDDGAGQVSVLALLLLHYSIPPDVLAFTNRLFGTRDNFYAYMLFVRSIPSGLITALKKNLYISSKPYKKCSDF